MEGISQKYSDAFKVEVINQSSVGNLIAFFQGVQSSGSIAGLCLVNLKNNKPALFVCGTASAFMVDSPTAQMFELERFFANTRFVVDTDRDLANILHFLPLQVQNIQDFRLAKLLTRKELPANGDTIKVFIEGAHDVENINISFLRDITSRFIQFEQTWGEILKTLENQNKVQIYESIIAERFMKAKLYNSTTNNLYKISPIYQVISQNERIAIDEALGLVHSCATNLDTPPSSVATLYAMETFAIKCPKTFDEITSISGLNKRVIHSAVMRKLLAVFSKIEPSIKRSLTMELFLEAILAHCGESNSIEKNLICSKYEIVSYLNGNQNVSFLSGWKKSVYGQKVLDFLEGRDTVACQDGKVVFLKK